MSEKFKFDLVFQIGLCVNDLDAVLQNWKDLVDFDHSSIIVRNTKDLYDTGDFEGAEMYNGKEVKPWFIKYYRFDFANLDIEIIEPLDKSPGNPYSDFLIRHGNGIHHLGCKIHDRPALIKKMEEMGIPPMLSSSMGEVLANGEKKGCIFYDLRDLLGIVVEAGNVVVGPMKSDPLAGNPSDYVDK
jgi:hypothetical protein